MNTRLMRLSLLLWCSAMLHAQDEAPDRTFLLVPSEGAARTDLHASGNMGSLVFPIHFDIPPSRGETTPTVELVYNSSNQKHGSWVGNGWTLDPGYIERSVKDGVPSYTLNDDFILNLGNVSGKLAQINTSPSGDTLEFRMEREALFLRVFFFKSTQVWLAVDRKGVEYAFGRGGFSRISSAQGVFRWALDRIENRQLNHTTTITYVRDGSWLYPEAINYVQGRVEFILGDHPQPFTTRKYGFIATIARILKGIRTSFRTPTGALQVASLYTIDYVNKFCAVDRDDEVLRLTPFISRITRVNADTTASLPPTSFTYTDESEANAQSALPQWAFPVISNGGFTESGGSGDNGVRLADLNNDGFPDIVQADGDDQRSTFLNNRLNGWSEVTTWRFPVIDNGGFTEDDGTGDNGVRLVDINNDGFADIVQADGASQRRTMLNNGVDGWVVTSDWQVPVIDNGGFTENDGSGDNGVLLVDVNGDSLVDIIQADGAGQRQTFLNNGIDGWVQTTNWTVPVIANAGFTENDGSGDNGVRFADLNNDGFIDIVQADGDDQRNTFLNNTVDGWVQTTSWQVPVIDNGGFTEDDGTGDNGVRIEDINGDGFADIVQADGDDQRKTFLNNKVDGWTSVSAWPFPVIDHGGFTEDDGTGDNGVRFVDVNNDGFIDIVQADGDAPDQHITFLNNGVDRWVLTTVPTTSLQLENNWQLTTSWEVPVMDRGGFTEDDGGGDNGVRFADVNADGYVDIIQADGDESGQHLTFLNNGINGWEGTSRWQLPILDGGFTENDGSGDNAVQLADVNGDGFVDILQADGDDPDQHRTYLNNGVDGWVFTTDWLVPVMDNGGFTESDGNGDNGVRLADVNGDGLVDIIQADDSDQRRTLLNNGVNGWTTSTLWQFPVIDNGGFTENGGEGDNGVRFADVNGDGLVDIVQADGDDQRATFLNNGVNAWVSTTAWRVPVIDHGGFTEDDGSGDNGVRLADVNGDGFVDIVQADGDKQRAVYLNNGVDGWMEVRSWQIPEISQGGFTEKDGGDDNGVRLVDVNGDGFVDIVHADGGSERRTYLNGVTRPPLLTRIDNGVGGISDVRYDAHTGLPVVYTVSEVSDHSGFLTTTVLYEFEGPFVDREEDEFRGFHLSRSIADQRIVETYYHQGNGDDAATLEHDDHFSKQGRPYFIKILHRENPTLYYQALRNTWGRRQLAPLYNFVFLDTEVIYDFDEDGRRHTAKASRYEYDQAGNLHLTEKYDYVTDNELDGVFADNAAADNLITRTEYAVDDAADPRLRAFPSRLTVEDVDGHILKETRFFYDSLGLGRLSAGRVTSEQHLRFFDDLSNAPTTFVTNTDPSSPDNVPTMVEVATYQYDSFGNVISRTNANGDRESYRYDPTNHYVAADTITVAKGKSTPIDVVTRFSYDYRCGKISETISPNGAIVRREYDDFGRLVTLSESDPEDVNTLKVKEQYSYLLNGVGGGISRNVIDKFSLSGSVTERQVIYRDGFLRVIQTKDLKSRNGFPVFATQDTRYSSTGQIELSTQPYFTTTSSFTQIPGNAPQIRSKYDGLGRLTATVPVNMDTTGSRVVGERFAFIVRGAKQGKIVRKGNQETEYLVDANQQITDVFQKDGEERTHTRYAYDVLDRLSGITDQKGNTITLRYDSFGRKREMRDPDIGINLYAYDNAGNTVLFVDGKNDTTRYAYDELFRQIARTYPQDPSENVTQVYDENDDTGYLTTIESSNVVSTIDYDPLGRIIRHNRQIDGDMYTLSMKYDHLGRILSLVYPDRDTVTYEYFNNGGQLFRVRLDTEIVAEFLEYTPLEKAISYRFGNGTHTENSFFRSEHRLRESTVFDPSGESLEHLSYRYDDIGNIVSLEDPVSGLTRRFGYDDLNRLTSFTFRRLPAESATTLTYSYDGIGNIVGKEGRTYAYDDVRPHIPLTLGSDVFQFDAAGNQTRGVAGARYEYDRQDRLVKAFDSDNNLVAEYAYDSMTGLLKKKTDAGITVFIDRLYEVDFARHRATKYVYAHQSLIAAEETAIPAEFNGSGFLMTPEDLQRFSAGAAAAVFVLMVSTVFFPPNRSRSSRMRFNARIRFVSSAVTGSMVFVLLFIPSTARAQDITRLVYFHTDHLGSVTLVTDAAGREIRRLEYKPFGEVMNTSGTFDSPYTFTGQRAETDVNLLYYQSRFYDPVMGRFIQPDVFVPDAADPQTLNRFSYVNNNPVNHPDPTGHWFGWDDLIVAGIGFAVGFGLALIGGADLKTALLAGVAGAISAWLAFNTFGAGGVYFQLGAQVAATASNRIFAGGRGGLAGDIVQLITTYAASPLTSTVGLLVGVGFIVFTDRTWNSDFHFFDGALWFSDRFRGKAAMTTGAVIHYEDESVFKESTIRHELTHRRQFGFTGDGFIAVYFTEIGIRMLSGQNQDDAYESQLFEQEAYSVDDRHGFLGPGSAEEAFQNIRLFDQNLLVSAPGRF
jgi:RHS repeat-associated protein